MRAREDEFLDWRILELARGNVGSICSGRQMRKPENVKNEFLIFFENRDFCFFEISKIEAYGKNQKTNSKKINRKNKEG